MAGKRGRPKKSSVPKINTNYVNQTIPHEGELLKERKDSNISKFDNLSLLNNYLLQFFDPFEKKPLGIIINNGNCEYTNQIYNLLSMIYTPNGSECLKQAVNITTQNFADIYTNYNTKNLGHIRTIAYTGHINLDMRKYVNLSVIYQIIYELQQKLFPDQYTLWKLCAPKFEISPFYTLRFVVSNASNNGREYISYVFGGDGFVYLTGTAFGIVNGTRGTMTNKDTHKINIKPILFDQYPINQNVSLKPDDISYLDWYKYLYGDEITKSDLTRLINTKPYDYSRNEF